jgi:hypothetical protein
LFPVGVALASLRWRRCTREIAGCGCGLVIGWLFLKWPFLQVRLIFAALHC